MWKTTIKGLLSRRGRLLLTALAVTFGTGFVAGTLILADSTTRALEGLRGYRPPADVSVRGPMVSRGPNVSQVTGRARLPERLLKTVRGIDAVRSAEGSVFGRAVPTRPDGQPLTKGIGEGIVGVSWVDAPGLVPYTLVTGRPPRGANEVTLASTIAARYRYSIGDRLDVRFERSSGQFTVVGVARFRSPDPVLGPVTMAFDPAAAQLYFGALGFYDMLHADGEAGVSASNLRSVIAADAPRAAQLLTPDMAAAEEVRGKRGEVRAVRDALLGFAAVSVFVGAFMVFNTFSILVAQRVRELALLRALGASRRQVRVSVMAEGSLVGLLGSLVGLALGVLIAVVLQGSVEGIRIGGGVHLMPRTVIVALLVGVGMSVLASVVPALRAARVPPVAALQMRGGEDPRLPRRRLASGTAVAVMGIGLIAVAASVEDPNLRLIAAGAAVTFIGITLVSPWLLRPVARWIGAPLIRLFGQPAKLGRNNAIRQPRRTAAAAAALMIGLGLVTLVAVFGESVKASGGQGADQMIALTTALLGVSVLIALFGIVNTLALSVLERTREIGLLRAVGMTRRQVRSMIRWEAVITSFFGAVLGIGLGIAFGWALITPLGSRTGLTFALPSPRLGVYAAAAGLAGVLAALPPARRAANLDVLDAIAHD